MRASPNLYDRIDSAMQSSESSLQLAMNQLSSGKRVSAPSDDPTAFAENITSLSRSSTVDTYTRNADFVLTQAQLADSALANVTTLLTQAISIGTQGGNSDLSAAQRQTLAQQVQSVFSSVLGQANTTAAGVALFAGTADVTAPFVADASAANGVRYVGNDLSNETQVGSSQQVAVNLPGSAVFAGATGDVFGSLQQLVGALQSGNTDDLSAAISAVTQAVSQVGQARAIYGSTVSQLNAQTSFLSKETLDLTSQQTELTDVDTATAATNLSQAQTLHSAVLAMAAKVLPESLLNYLH